MYATHGTLSGYYNEPGLFDRQGARRGGAAANRWYVKSAFEGETVPRTVPGSAYLIFA